MQTSQKQSGRCGIVTAVVMTRTPRMRAPPSIVSTHAGVLPGCARPTRHGVSTRRGSNVCRLPGMRSSHSGFHRPRSRSRDISRLPSDAIGKSLPAYSSSARR